MLKFHLLFGALLVAVCLPARAQSTGSPPAGSTPSATAPTTADMQAVVPKLRYRSPFAAYQADRVEKPRSWREVNDRVGDIGGWRIYARESQPPTVTQTTPTPPPTTSGK